MYFISKVSVSFFVFQLFFCAEVLCQVNLNNGLIGCYPFSGNANDLCEEQNHGSVNGAKLAADRFGNLNSAYDFDGYDDYIELDPANLQGNTFSYSFWVYPRVAPEDGQAFFMFSIGSTYGDQHVMLAKDYTGVMNGLAQSSYMGYYYNVRCSSGPVPPLFEWYHIVLVKDPDAYHFYVNGKLICTNSTNGSSAYYGIGQVKATIGARNNYGAAINAVMDDFHLYNRPLNMDEVQALFKGQTQSQPATVTLSADNLSQCAGSNVSFEANATGNPVDFTWSVDGVTKLSGQDSKFNFVWPEQTSVYKSKVSVEVTYNQCFPQPPVSDEKIVEIRNCTTPEEESRLIVPSAFSPNLDGKNDTWQIYNAESFSELEITVFSQWGEAIFHSKGYQYPWDGRYRNSPVAPGVYPYKILSSGKLIRQGAVNILR
ncbi:LamG-like jellyroll fold domain-containing protein [Dyadobacter bucti]|uniref:LamG-like jellyroll fold domain-containing protein n=1 Tax=Dyadobacter bucti TaxID=2572203 RepID=UPI003F70DC38